MKINLLEPQGYCHGVRLALKKVEETINNPSLPRPIYLLGEIIHNKYVIQKCIDSGLIIIDENNKLEKLKKIETGTIILQAHGSSPEIYRLIAEKNLTLVDATCPFVKIVHHKIHKALDANQSIIYIGKKNHAESEAAIMQAPNIIFITSLEDIDKLNSSSSPVYVTNQTTLSKYDLELYFQKLQQKFPQATIDNKICDATSKRQEAVKQMPIADLTIVIGDKTSSNSKRLFELAKEKGEAIFIENVMDIKNYNFNNIRTINITSGASTPHALVLEVCDFLESLPK